MPWELSDENTGFPVPARDSSMLSYIPPVQQHPLYFQRDPILEAIDRPLTPGSLKITADIATQLELLRQTSNLKPGQRVEVYTEKFPWFSEPDLSIERRADGEFRTSLGGGFLSAPHSVVRTVNSESCLIALLLVPYFSLITQPFRSSLINAQDEKKIIRLIEAYQAEISPRIHEALSTERVCRYTPSCSEYAKEAVTKYGSIKGSLIALKRVSRCNPYSKGGEDPLC